MEISVQSAPARIGAGLSIQGYAVICDRELREWYKTKREADRMAELIKQDSQNPEDY
tara:strand:- start:28541 stop:28711 length:171 start_codon:yes stop_codon:yes gene_type:complete